MKKKIVALFLSVIMAMGCFAGCGQSADDEKKKTGESEATETSSTQETETNKEKKSEEVTTLTWYISGSQDDTYQAVWDEVNKLLEERYNLKLEMNIIDGGNFDQKLQMMNASCEEYDLAYTATWTNNIYTNIQNGSLYDLTDLLPEYAPTVWAEMSEAEKQSARGDSRIYAVPNWQLQTRTTALSVPKDKLEKTSYTMDDLKTLEDIEKYLEEIVAVEPESKKFALAFGSSMMAYYDMCYVVGENLPGAIRLEDGKPAIINQYETDEFRAFVKTMYEWYQKGLMDTNGIADKEYRNSDIQQAPCWINSNYSPGDDVSQSARYGYDIYVEPISNAIMSTESILAAATCVGAYSKHPEKAVQMMEILRTDPEIYNMLVYGVEGVNFEKVGDTQIKKIEGSTYGISNWEIGNVRYSYVLENESVDKYQQLKEYNDNGVASALIGFSVDTTDIISQIGNCETVIKEKLNNMEYGQVEDPDKAVDEFIQALKDAGADEIITEVQNQVDTWWAAK